MGTSINAWIEYDDNPDYYPDRGNEPPFTYLSDGFIPLTDSPNFRSGKDYRFFAAISGIRSQQGDPPPLFSLRGLPQNISGYAKHAVDDVADLDDPNFGWLTYCEIQQALAHMSVARDQLSLHTNIVLDLMQAIDRRLGEGRSRLIFYIE